MRSCLHIKEIHHERYAYLHHLVMSAKSLFPWCSGPRRKLPGCMHTCTSMLTNTTVWSLRCILILCQNSIFIHYSLACFQWRSFIKIQVKNLNFLKHVIDKNTVRSGVALYCLNNLKVLAMYLREFFLETSCWNISLHVIN